MSAIARGQISFSSILLEQEKSAVMSTWITINGDDSQTATVDGSYLQHRALGLAYASYGVSVDDLDDAYDDLKTFLAGAGLFDGTDSFGEVFDWEEYSELLAAYYKEELAIQTAIDGSFLSRINNLFGTKQDASTIAYLINALNESTIIDNGLILTSLIQLGQRSGGVFNVLSGINGTVNTQLQDPTKSIAAWYGGPMVDHEADSSAQSYAKSLFRMDGSGYLAGGNIFWNAAGYGGIPGITWSNDPVTGHDIVTIGANVRLESLSGEDTVAGVLNLVQELSDLFELVLIPGTSTYAVHVKNGRGLYSDSFVSAGGIGSGGGGGGVDLLDVWQSLTNNPSLVSYDEYTDIALSHIPNLPWSQITSGKPTTLGGYGITDAYTKSETYTRAEVSQQIANALTGAFVSVDMLPPIPTAANLGKIYLVPSPNPDEHNIKDEYIAEERNGSYYWEQIGSTALDLSDYVTDEDLDDAIDGVFNNMPFIEGSGTDSAEQWNCTASGNYSVASGYNTASNGSASHTEGNNTLASGDNAHAEGYRTTATGANAHIEGRSQNNRPSLIPVSDEQIIAAWNTSRFSLAKGNAAHAEGYNGLALANYSHVEGAGCIAQGVESHAEGYFAITSNAAEHAEGQWNKSNTGSTAATKTTHSVGIGASEATRKNAFEIMQNGDAYLFGLGTYDGTNPTSGTNDLKTIINSKYVKPSGGIPKTDLESAVQTSLTLANTAVQPSALNGYLPLTGGTITGDLYINATLDLMDGGYIALQGDNLLSVDSNYNLIIGASILGGNVNISGEGTLYYNSSKVWHEGNDGASSGLDADLLDGQHGSYYATASSVSTLQGYFTSGVANSAARLSGKTAYTAFGNTFFNNGVPVSIAAGSNITGTGNIVPNRDEDYELGASNKAWIATHTYILSTNRINPLTSGSAISSNGNLVPFTNNAFTLGSSSYRWSTIYGVNGNLSGTLNVTGAATLSGGITTPALHASSSFISVYNTIGDEEGGTDWAISRSGNAYFSGDLTVDGVSKLSDIYIINGQNTSAAAGGAQKKIWFDGSTHSANSPYLELVNVGTSASPVWALHTNASFYADGFISAGGIGTGGSGGGGIDISDVWQSLTNSANPVSPTQTTKISLDHIPVSLSGTTITFNDGIHTAQSINVATATDLSNYVNTLTSDSSTGNVVTAISKSGNTLTVTKGITALVASDLDGYVNDISQGRTPANPYISGVSKSGKTITFILSSLPQIPLTYPLSSITDADDLKAIEALTGTSGLLKKTAANTWTLDTTSYATSASLGNYLPLSGGQMTGPLTWSGETALPSTTSASYFLTIDAFASGGTTKWISLANAKTSLGLQNYVLFNPGTVEQTITSQISSMSKGVVNFWRKSGDHYTFIGFSNGTTETYLGGIGFKSQSDHNLYHKDGSNYYKIYDENNLTKSVVTTLIGSTTYAPYNANGYLPLSGGSLSGNLSITGNLTLSGTIGNGTYTYTLPSKTGTLAIANDKLRRPVGQYLSTYSTNPGVIVTTDLVKGNMAQFVIYGNPYSAARGGTLTQVACYWYASTDTFYTVSGIQYGYPLNNIKLFSDENNNICLYFEGYAGYSSYIVYCYKNDTSNYAENHVVSVGNVPSVPSTATRVTDVSPKQGWNSMNSNLSTVDWTVNNLKTAGRITIPVGSSASDSTKGITFLSGSTGKVQIGANSSGVFGIYASGSIGLYPSDWPISSSSTGALVLSSTEATLASALKLSGSTKKIWFGDTYYIELDSNNYLHSNAPFWSDGFITAGGIGSGGGSITIDNALSPTSENPVQNKVIYNTIGNVESLLAAI